jgi:hypothetical protein
MSKIARRRPALDDICSGGDGNDLTLTVVP